MERNTRQRTATREAIARAGRSLLPREVLEAAQASAPGFSIATLYRHLRALLDEGALRSMVLPGENARDVAAGGAHQHHFQCLTCRRVFEVDVCLGRVASLAPPGFTAQDHDLTLYGRCGGCGPRRARRASASAGKSIGSKRAPAADGRVR